jgi:hypothetical protein
MVVSVGEKAPYRRQVRGGKTNESEPLMTRRKGIQPTSKPGGVVGPGLVQALPVYGLSGVRCRGGMIPSQALVRNVGTCRPDGKGERQAGSPREPKSTDAGHRGGAARSSVEAPERAWSKGAASSGRPCGSTRVGRNP